MLITCVCAVFHSLPCNESLYFQQHWSDRALTLPARTSEFRGAFRAQENVVPGRSPLEVCAVTRKTSIAFTLIVLLTFFACGGGNLGPGTAATTTFAKSSFTAGIAHVAGNYGFTQENYLLEGAKKFRSWARNRSLCT